MVDIKVGQVWRNGSGIVYKVHAVDGPRVCVRANGSEYRMTAEELTTLCTLVEPVKPPAPPKPEPPIQPGQEWVSKSGTQRFRVLEIQADEAKIVNVCHSNAPFYVEFRDLHDRCELADASNYAPPASKTANGFKLPNKDVVIPPPPVDPYAAGRNRELGLRCKNASGEFFMTYPSYGAPALARAAELSGVAKLPPMTRGAVVRIDHGWDE